MYRTVHILIYGSTLLTNGTVRYVETLVIVFISANRYLQGKLLFLYKLILNRTYKPLYYVQMYIKGQNTLRFLKLINILSLLTRNRTILNPSK